MGVAKEKGQTYKSEAFTVKVLPEGRLPGKSIGLDIRSPDELIEKLNKGFATDTFDILRRELGVTVERLIELIDISRKTLDRRKKIRRFGEAESERVYRYAKLFDLAKDLFGGDRKKARKWFHAPNISLGGETPLDYAKTEPGAQIVEDLIIRLEYGEIA